MKISAIFLLIVLFLSLLPIAAQSSSGVEASDETIDYSSVVLSEILPNPVGNDTDLEWVELYNSAFDAIDISACTVDGLSLPPGTLIEGGSFLIVAKQLIDKDKDMEAFEISWGNGSGVWGDDLREDFTAIEVGISLKNGADQIVFNCSDYEDSYEWDNATEGVSFSRDEDGEWSDEFPLSPGYANTLAPGINYPSTILISELYPSPDTHKNEEEWLELYNFGEEDINLLGWFLTDNTGKQVISNNAQIKTNSYLVLKGDSLELTLNNTGEQITLFNPSNEEIDSFVYKDTPTGIANIRKWKDGGYENDILQSKASTEGSQNVYADPLDVFYGRELMAIKDTKKLELGTEVFIKGKLIVEMNKLGKKIFYVQDSLSGIQVYCASEEFGNEYKTGDELEMVGELRVINGELRIYLSDENSVRKVSSKNELTVTTKKTGEIGKAEEGNLVFVMGEIVETSGSSFYIDDGSGRVKILVKTSTGIDLPRKKIGQTVNAIGIVSQYGKDESGEPLMRILPRYQSDILVLDTPFGTGEVLAVTGVHMNNVSFIGGILIIFAWYLEARRRIVLTNLL